MSTENNFIIPFNVTEYKQADKSTELSPGDRVWMRFKLIPGWLYVKAAGINAIEKKLAQRQEFEILGSSYNEDAAEVWYHIEIKEIYPQGFEGPLPPGAEYEKTKIYTAGTISLGVIVSLFLLAGTIYFSLKSIGDNYVKVSQNKAIESGNMSPSEAVELNKSQTANSLGTQIQKAGAGIALPIAAAAGLLFFWSRRR